jgi:hypothetical protein
VVRESNGEECDMTLKNNIEGIIIKWAYQIEEVGTTGLVFIKFLRLSEDLRKVGFLVCKF